MKSTVEATEDALATVREIAHRHEVRLSTWVAVANAGALLFCFNAMLNHAVCDWIAFRPLVAMFAIGLVAAYVSVWATLRGEQRNARIITEIATLAVRYEGLNKTLEDLNKTNLSAFSKSELAGHQAQLEALNTEHTKHVASVERIKQRAARSRIYEWTSNATLTGSAVLFGAALVSALVYPNYVEALCPG